MPTGFAESRTRHGTPSGYRLHQELGERPCDPCYFAKQAYDAERLKQPRQTIINRLNASAQMWAYVRLARRYRDEYRALYLHRKTVLWQEAEENGIL